MLSRLLVAGVLAGAAAGGLIGQTTPAPFDWASLVGGAVGSSPAALVLAWELTKADKRSAAKDEIIREKDEHIQRLHADDRARTERVTTVLAETGRTLAAVHEGMEATLDRGRPARDIERVVRRLEGALHEVEQGRDQRGHPDDRHR